MIPHLFLPVGGLGTPVAFCHAARCLAQPMRDSTGNASHTHQRRRQRSEEPKPFEASPTSPPVPCVSTRLPTPARLPVPRRSRCRRPTDARGRSTPPGTFVPTTGRDYRGWLGLGTPRANGHPEPEARGASCPVASCKGYFLETHGTLFHGKRLAVELHRTGDRLFS